MPDSTILNLLPAGPITGAEVIPIVQDGDNVRTTQATLTADLVTQSEFDAATANMVTSPNIFEMVEVTQAEYDALTPVAGVFYVIPDEIGTVISAIRTTDKSVANNTIVDDGVLTIELTAGWWSIDGSLYADNAAATADIAIRWTAPADATGLLNIGGQTTSATSAFGSVAQSTVGREAAANRGLIAGSATWRIPLVGFVLIITAGEYKIQWAQATTDGANPTFARAGSAIKAVKAA